jgi:hypothetical protein
MADDNQLKAVRDSFMKATGQDPTQMDEETKQRMEQQAKLDAQKKQQDDEDEESGPMSIARQLWERVKDGIIGTGRPLDQTITESTKRLQQQQLQQGRGIGSQSGKE